MPSESALPRPIYSDPVVVLGSLRTTVGKTHFLRGNTKVNQLASRESRESTQLYKTCNQEQEVREGRKSSCAWRRWHMLYMFAWTDTKQEALNELPNHNR